VLITDLDDVDLTALAICAWIQARLPTCHTNPPALPYVVAILHQKQHQSARARTMASVTSLDQDMRKLRMERVTPQAEEEVRAFIQASLKSDPEEPNAQKRARDKEIDSELLVKLGQEGLFDFLGDGVALCRYVFTQVTCRLSY
jgi:hypothetical protein